MIIYDSLSFIQNQINAENIQGLQKVHYTQNTQNTQNKLSFLFANAMEKDNINAFFWTHISSFVLTGGWSWVQ